MRTIEVTLGRSASLQSEPHRQRQQVVVGGLEEAALQWGTKDKGGGGGGGAAATAAPPTAPPRRGANRANSAIFKVRANSTKNPSPRQNPTERPTDPARCGKGGSKGGIKEEPNVQALCRKNLDFFPDDRQTPARREARNHRSEDAEILGPLPRGPQRTGRADQREARGDANRDRSTQNHRRRVLLSATQRPRSTNNETTTTTRHPELRDPRSDSSEDKLRGVACSFIERH